MIINKTLVDGVPFAFFLMTNVPPAPPLSSLLFVEPPPTRNSIVSPATRSKEADNLAVQGDEFFKKCGFI